MVELCLLGCSIFFLTLNLVSFYPKITSLKYNFRFRKNFSNQLLINDKLYVNIERMLKRYNSLFFVIKLNVGVTLKKSQFIPYEQNFKLYKNLSLNDNIDCIPHFLNNWIIVDFEYHFFMSKNYSIFAFINYSNKLKTNLRLMYLYLEYYDNYMLRIGLSKTYLGLGFQIKTPIRQIPVIRIQYLFNSSQVLFGILTNY